MVRATFLPFAFIAALAALALGLQRIAAMEEASAPRPLTLIALAP